MSPAPVEVQNFDDYVTALRGSNVITQGDERRKIIRDELERIGKDENATVVRDDWLINHVANIVEFPVALAGKFDEQYLDLPREVLVTTLRDHQKYFVMEDADGNLLPNFVTISNMLVPDWTVVTKGNQRVLTARLEDAKFYFQDDLNTPLEKMNAGLSGMLYQADLGTYLEKTERNRRMAGYLAKALAPDITEFVDRAALLAKADLVSGVVGEFPELQGIMGMHYARRQNEAAYVAEAIREHYLPKGQGTDLPKTKVGAIVSLADKLDTICGCFGVGLAPTGKGDPFALRRAALGVIHILADLDKTLDLRETVRFGIEGVLDKIKAKSPKTDAKKLEKTIVKFFHGRLTHLLKGEKLPTKIVDAVLSVRFDDLVEAKKRAQAVCAFAKQDEFEPFAITFKRVANIITTAKDNLEGVVVDPDKFDCDAERNLLEATIKVESTVAGHVEKADHLGALSTIATIRPLVDTFFEDVLVMAKEYAIRTNRLALLGRINAMFANIADFKRV
jgi:glycyl-tRNA synthetase beta chain